MTDLTDVRCCLGYGLTKIDAVLLSDFSAVREYQDRYLSLLLLVLISLALADSFFYSIGKLGEVHGSCLQ